MPYLQDQQIKKLLDALYRYLKRKGQRKRVTKKQLKKVVFRDCPGLLSRAVLGLQMNETDSQAEPLAECASNVTRSSHQDQDSEHPSSNKKAPPILRRNVKLSLCGELKIKLVVNKLAHVLTVLFLRKGFNSIEARGVTTDSAGIAKSASQQHCQNQRQIALDKYKLLRGKQQTA
jgi:hypothetical protein